MLLLVLTICLLASPLDAQTTSDWRRGERVRVEGATEILGPSHTRSGTAIVGAFVAQHADTLTLRDPANGDVRTVILGRGARIERRLPQGSSDAILPGDAFRLDGVDMEVERIDGDAIHFRRGSATVSLSAEDLFAPESRHERLIRTSFRPAMLILGAGAGILGGVALVRAGDRAAVRHTEGNGAGGLLTAPAVGLLYVIGSVTAVGVGVGLGWRLAAPRTEWEAVSGRPAPTIRIAPDGGGGVGLSLRFPTTR